MEEFMNNLLNEDQGSSDFRPLLTEKEAIYPNSFENIPTFDQLLEGISISPLPQQPFLKKEGAIFHSSFENNPTFDQLLKEISASPLPRLVVDDLLDTLGETDGTLESGCIGIIEQREKREAIDFEMSTPTDDDNLYQILEEAMKTSPPSQLDSITDFSCRGDALNEIMNMDIPPGTEISFLFSSDDLQCKDNEITVASTHIRTKVVFDTKNNGSCTETKEVICDLPVATDIENDESCTETKEDISVAIDIENNGSSTDTKEDISVAIDIENNGSCTETKEVIHDLPMAIDIENTTDYENLGKYFSELSVSSSSPLSTSTKTKTILKYSDDVKVSSLSTLTQNNSSRCQKEEVRILMPDSQSSTSYSSLPVSARQWQGRQSVKYFRWSDVFNKFTEIILGILIIFVLFILL